MFRWRTRSSGAVRCTQSWRNSAVSVQSKDRYKAAGSRRTSTFFFFSSRRRHTRFDCDWSSDVCSSDLDRPRNVLPQRVDERRAVGLGQHERVLAGQRAGVVEILARRHALVAEPRERRGELASVTRQLRFEIPIRRGAKREALLLAIDDEADGDALDAAGAEPRLHFLPEYRRDRVAIETIEDAPALLRANEAFVHFLRVLH